MNHSSESTIASEKFEPSLNEYYKRCFDATINKLRLTLPINRISVLKNEIAQINFENTDDIFEAYKYSAALNVLVDLSQQGWCFDINDDGLTLKMENENIDDKAKIRYRLSAERNAQFSSDSISSFINKMEAYKTYHGERISIRSLVGSSQQIIDAIHNNERLCEPYIQLVTNERDEYTGYKLSDIWRYFRYTWSIPYKTMPGRNLFYLVRDGLQPCHPIIGIFALGNSVLNLTVRDDDIGWTVDSIKSNMSKQVKTTTCEQIVSNTDGAKIKTKICTPTETDEMYVERATAYANRIYPLLLQNIEDAISEIYLKDLAYHRNTKYPKAEKINELLQLAAEYSEKSINNKNNEKNPKWEEEAQSNLFKRKRAAELAKLLSTKRVFNSLTGNTSYERLNQLLATEVGRKAIHTALIANRKRKIGSNMMEIIVCGAIPPYNELLGGKLISILACSPVVIRDYTQKYSNQVSEIASRMKGKKVVRDSQLVHLGTTSLYAVGSSQYNRIRVPVAENFNLEYRRMGITEGYGTVFFSKETTATFSKLLEIKDGGKRINHVFGEGTSPRFRMISRGLASIGIKAEAFLKHYSPRIVYSINLAQNTNDFLMGLDDAVCYGYDINDPEVIETKTQELIEYWYNRWALRRIENVDIEARLLNFNIENLLLGNI